MIILLFLQAQVSLGAMNCQRLLAPTEVQNTSFATHASKSFPQYLSFGLETEFDISKNPSILNDYRLSSIPAKEWKTMTLSERVASYEKLRTRFKLIQFLDHWYNLTKLVKLDHTPDWAPASLSIETHGTAEVSGIVKPDFGSFAEITNNISNRYGKGFGQSHVVYPKGLFENLGGYSLFFSDAGQLKILNLGYRKYLSDLKSIPGANLVHYALGPPSEVSRAVILENSHAAEVFGKLGSGGDHRLIYGPALRDDVYPKGLVGFELRHYSTNTEAMINATAELATLLSLNKISVFKEYMNVRMIESKNADRIQEFYPQIDMTKIKRFFAEVEIFLKKKSGSYFVGGAPFSERFFFPLRDWEHNPILNISENPEKMVATISSATKTYASSVVQIVNANQPIETAIQNLQIAVSKWAYEVNLDPLYDQFVKSVLTPAPGNPSMALSKKVNLKDRSQDDKSVRPLDRRQLTEKGQEVEEDPIIFNNLKHQDSRWIGVIYPEDIEKAYLVIEKRKDKTGNLKSHAMFRIDLNKKGRSYLLEMKDGDIGMGTRTNSIYLSISYQLNSKNKANGQSGVDLKDKTNRIAYKAFSADYFLENFGGAELQTVELNLPQDQLPKLLTTYLEKSELESGVDYFSHYENNCASNCYQIMKNVTRMPKTVVGRVLELVSYKAKWALSIFRMNGWLIDNEVEKLVK
jgi:hypothetical protein